jgi:thiosulfate/3-mercaptopyruvate sulfurtransferase
VLDGGLPARKAAGYEVTDVVLEPTPRTFTGTRRPELIRSTQDIAEGLEDEQTMLVDSMTACAGNPELPLVTGDSPR